MRYGNKKCTAQNIIIATGSTPFVPPGIEVDGKTVFTRDDALKLDWLPPWVAIIGSGYIGLEFSDVYTALGSDVTFIEAMPKIMPGFDAEIGKQAERILINPRNIDYVTNVLATKVTPGVPGEKPVTIELMRASRRARWWTARWTRASSRPAARRTPRASTWPRSTSDSSDERAARTSGCR